MQRRKLERRHLIYYLRVFDQDTNTLLGHVADLTTEGIMLVTERPLEAARTYRMAMDLPNKIMGKERVDFQAECLWCKEDVNPDFYVAGFQIVDVAPQHIETIEALLRRAGFEH